MNPEKRPHPDEDEDARSRRRADELVQVVPDEVLFAVIPSLLQADLCHVVDGMRAATSKFTREVDAFLMSEQYWETILSTWARDAPWTGVLDEAPPSKYIDHLPLLFKEDAGGSWFVNRGTSQTRPNSVDLSPFVQAACDQVVARWMGLVDERKFDKPAFWKQCQDGTEFRVTTTARVPRLPVWTHTEVQKLVGPASGMTWVPMGGDPWPRDRVVAVLGPTDLQNRYYYLNPLDRHQALQASQGFFEFVYYDSGSRSRNVRANAATETPFTPPDPSFTPPDPSYEPDDTLESLKAKAPLDPTDELRRRWLEQRQNNQHEQAESTRRELLDLRLELLKMVCWEIDLRQKIVTSVAVLVDVLEDVGEFGHVGLKRLGNVDPHEFVNLTDSAKGTLSQAQYLLRMLCAAAGAGMFILNPLQSSSLMGWVYIPTDWPRTKSYPKGQLLVSSARLAAKAFLRTHPPAERFRIGQRPADVQALRDKWIAQHAAMAAMIPAIGGPLRASVIREQNRAGRMARYGTD